MPIIKSAKKRVHQSEVRRKRNFATRKKVKAAIKEVDVLVKEKNTEEAKKKLSIAYKVIDTATKKNVLHRNNAAHKKAKLARQVKEIQA